MAHSQTTECWANYTALFPPKLTDVFVLLAFESQINSLQVLGVLKKKLAKTHRKCSKDVYLLRGEKNNSLQNESRLVNRLTLAKRVMTELFFWISRLLLSQANSTFGMVVLSETHSACVRFKLSQEGLLGHMQDVNEELKMVLFWFIPCTVFKNCRVIQDSVFCASALALKTLIITSICLTNVVD